MKYFVLILCLFSFNIFADTHHHHHYRHDNRVHPIVPFGLGIAGGMVLHQAISSNHHFEHHEYYSPPPPINYNQPKFIWCSYYNNYIPEHSYCPY